MVIGSPCSHHANGVVTANVGDERDPRLVAFLGKLDPSRFMLSINVTMGNTKHLYALPSGSGVHGSVNVVEQLVVALFTIRIDVLSREFMVQRRHYQSQS